MRGSLKTRLLFYLVSYKCHLCTHRIHVLTWILLFTAGRTFRFTACPNTQQRGIKKFACQEEIAFARPSWFATAKWSADRSFWNLCNSLQPFLYSIKERFCSVLLPSWQQMQFEPHPQRWAHLLTRFVLAVISCFYLRLQLLNWFNPVHVQAVSLLLVTSYCLPYSSTKFCFPVFCSNSLLWMTRPSPFSTCQGCSFWNCTHIHTIHLSQSTCVSWENCLTAWLQEEILACLFCFCFPLSLAWKAQDLPFTKQSIHIQWHCLGDTIPISSWAMSLFMSVCKPMLRESIFEGIF